ncbi:MAG: hypothetical protein KIS94_06210 [Chitinophagales bacterium]|nr:hypothetical protein [Chitinophagales bacterium]
MDDKSLKNFDRHIEQVMNEGSVTPPFGAWNRIAAELEAAPAAGVATGAVGTTTQPLFNTGAVLGFISGALLIGTLITGWLLYNNYNNNSISVTPVVNTELPVEEIVTTTQPVATEPVLQAPVEVKTTRIVSTTPKVEKSATEVPAKLQNNEVAAPTVKLPMDKQKNTDEVYYFPPVDINTGTPTENTTATADEEDEDNDADEVKIAKKVTQSSSSGERIKFKKKRKTNWTYGRLNKTKNKSKF